MIFFFDVKMKTNGTESLAWGVGEKDLRG